MQCLPNDFVPEGATWVRVVRKLTTLGMPEFYFFEWRDNEGEFLAQRDIYAPPLGLTEDTCKLQEIITLLNEWSIIQQEENMRVYIHP